MSVEPDFPAQPPAYQVGSPDKAMGNQAYVPPDFDPTGASGSGGGGNGGVGNMSGNIDPSSTRRSQANGGIFTFAYYATFFDVDTREVGARCLLALNPFHQQPFLDDGDLEGGTSGASSTVMGGRPDLYGPFWICTTVVVTLFFASTLVGLLFSSWEGVKYEYQFDLLTGAAGLMYGYTFVVPTGLWFVVRYLNLSPNTTLLQLIALYGYSNITWIPVAILSVSPILGVPTLSNIIRWIFIGLGFLFSATFIIKNLRRRLPLQAGDNSTERTQSLVILAVVSLLHVGLAVAVKFLFFGVKKT